MKTNYHPSILFLFLTTFFVQNIFATYNTNSSTTSVIPDEKSSDITCFGTYQPTIPYIGDRVLLANNQEYLIKNLSTISLLKRCKNCELCNFSIKKCNKCKVNKSCNKCKFCNECKFFGDKSYKIKYIGFNLRTGKEKSFFEENIKYVCPKIRDDVNTPNVGDIVLYYFPEDEHKTRIEALKITACDKKNNLIKGYYLGGDALWLREKHFLKKEILKLENKILSKRNELLIKGKENEVDFEKKEREIGNYGCIVNRYKNRLEYLNQSHNKLKQEWKKISIPLSSVEKILERKNISVGNQGISAKPCLCLDNTNNLFELIESRFLNIGRYVQSVHFKGLEGTPSAREVYYKEKAYNRRDIRPSSRFFGERGSFIQINSEGKDYFNEDVEVNNSPSLIFICNVYDANPFFEKNLNLEGRYIHIYEKKSKKLISKIDIKLLNLEKPIYFHNPQRTEFGVVYPLNHSSNKQSKSIKIIFNSILQRNIFERVIQGKTGKSIMIRDTNKSENCQFYLWTSELKLAQSIKSYWAIKNGDSHYKVANTLENLESQIKDQIRTFDSKKNSVLEIKINKEYLKFNDKDICEYAQQFSNSLEKTCEYFYSNEKPIFEDEKLVLDKCPYENGEAISEEEHLKAQKRQRELEFRIKQLREENEKAMEELKALKILLKSLEESSERKKDNNRRVCEKYNVWWKSGQEVPKQILENTTSPLTKRVLKILSVYKEEKNNLEKKILLISKRLNSIKNNHNSGSNLFLSNFHLHPPSYLLYEGLFSFCQKKLFLSLELERVYKLIFYDIRRLLSGDIGGSREESTNNICPYLEKKNISRIRFKESIQKCPCMGIIALLEEMIKIFNFYDSNFCNSLFSTYGLNPKYEQVKNYISFLTILFLQKRTIYKDGEKSNLVDLLVNHAIKFYHGILPTCPSYPLECRLMYHSEKKESQMFHPLLLNNRNPHIFLYTHNNIKEKIEFNYFYDEKYGKDEKREKEEYEPSSDMIAVNLPRPKDKASFLIKYLWFLDVATRSSFFPYELRRLCYDKKSLFALKGIPYSLFARIHRLPSGTIHGICLTDLHDIINYLVYNIENTFHNNLIYEKLKYPLSIEEHIVFLLYSNNTPIKQYIDVIHDFGPTFYYGGVIFKDLLDRAFDKIRNTYEHKNLEYILNNNESYTKCTRKNTYVRLFESNMCEYLNDYSAESESYSELLSIEEDRKYTNFNRKSFLMHFTDCRSNIYRELKSDQFIIFSSDSLTPNIFYPQHNFGFPENKSWYISAKELKKYKEVSTNRYECRSFALLGYDGHHIIDYSIYQKTYMKYTPIQIQKFRIFFQKIFKKFSCNCKRKLAATTSFEGAKNIVENHLKACYPVKDTYKISQKLIKKLLKELVTIAKQIKKPSFKHFSKN